MVFFELSVFLLGGYLLIRWALRAWKWADIKEKIIETKEVETQFDKVTEFVDQHADIEEKREQVHTFRNSWGAKKNES